MCNHAKRRGGVKELLGGAFALKREDSPERAGEVDDADEVQLARRELQDDERAGRLAGREGGG